MRFLISVVLLCAVALMVGGCFSSKFMENPARTKVESTKKKSIRERVYKTDRQISRLTAETYGEYFDGRSIHLIKFWAHMEMNVSKTIDEPFGYVEEPTNIPSKFQGVEINRILSITVFQADPQTNYQSNYMVEFDVVDGILSHRKP